MAKYRVSLWQTLLIALCVVIAPVATALGAPDKLRKVSVVSFGLFGDQRVFQSEATGAASDTFQRRGCAYPLIRPCRKILHCTNSCRSAAKMHNPRPRGVQK